MEQIHDYYELNNGFKIPAIGFGTYKAAVNGMEVIRTAINAGYRYFDTAAFYNNEEEIAEAVESSGIKREELFLASKAWKGQMGYKEVKEAFEESLKKLRTDYLDLYLIHWPLPEVGYEDWKKLDIDTWKGMEELYQEGRIKAIGVSNFLPHHIENLLEHTQIKPAVNQIEFHPGHTQEVTLQYCKDHNIRVQAWSPLGRKRVLEYSVLVKMAEKYGVSTAKLCIRYAYQRGVMPLPKASSYDRMKDNLEVSGFEISAEDMYRIGSLPPTGWSGEHPDMERVYFN